MFCETETNAFKVFPVEMLEELGFKWYILYVDF